MLPHSRGSCLFSLGFDNPSCWDSMDASCWCWTASGCVVSAAVGATLSIFVGAAGIFSLSSIFSWTDSAEFRLQARRQPMVCQGKLSCSLLVLMLMWLAVFAVGYIYFQLWPTSILDGSPGSGGGVLPISRGGGGPQSSNVTVQAMSWFGRWLKGLVTEHWLPSGYEGYNSWTYILCEFLI